MIGNEQQYRVTQDQIGKFELAIEEFDVEKECGVHPLLRKAQKNAMQSQLSSLRDEVEEYDRKQFDNFEIS
jgi:hypothetical protein